MSPEVESIVATAPTKLELLIERSDIRITSISVSPGRTRSDGHYGNDKYGVLIAAEVAEDASVTGCFQALYEAALGELDRQEAYHDLLSDLTDELHAWDVEELRARREKIASLPGLHNGDRARLLARADAATRRAQERQREREERESRAVLPFAEEEDDEEAEYFDNKAPF